MILLPEGLMRYVRVSALGELSSLFDVVIWGPGNKPLDLLATVLTAPSTIRIDGVARPGVVGAGMTVGLRRAGRSVRGLRTSFTLPAHEPVPVVLLPKP